MMFLGLCCQIWNNLQNVYIYILLDCMIYLNYMNNDINQNMALCVSHSP